jgi:hypothetical protein
VAEVAQQHQPRQVAFDVRGLVDHDLQPRVAAIEQESRSTAVRVSEFQSP